MQNLFGYLDEGKPLISLAFSLSRLELLCQVSIDLTQTLKLYSFTNRLT